MRPIQTKVINLWGGPGSGKSTLAAGVFYELKRRGYSAELVTEYAKELAWENRPIGKYDQVQIAAEQIKREARLLGKVQFIVTDSPVMFSDFYEGYFRPNVTLTKSLIDKYHWEAHVDGHSHSHFLLPKPKHKFEKRGRYQNKREAAKIHKAMTDFTYQVKLKTTKPSEVLQYVLP